MAASLPAASLVRTWPLWSSAWKRAIVFSLSSQTKMSFLSLQVHKVIWKHDMQQACWCRDGDMTRDKHKNTCYSYVFWTFWTFWCHLKHLLSFNNHMDIVLSYTLTSMCCQYLLGWQPCGTLRLVNIMSRKVWMDDTLNIIYRVCWFAMTIYSRYLVLIMFTPCPVMALFLHNSVFSGENKNRQEQQQLCSMMPHK